jgi:hypothetical protein
MPDLEVVLEQKIQEISIQHGRENSAKLPTLADPPSADSVMILHASGPSCNHASPFARLVLPSQFPASKGFE